MPEKKKKKEPLDMTTEEMANYLFPKKVVEKLNEVAHAKDKPPTGDENGAEGKGKSTRKHGTT